MGSSGGSNNSGGSKSNPKDNKRGVIGVTHDEHGKATPDGIAEGFTDTTVCNGKLQGFNNLADNARNSKAGQYDNVRQQYIDAGFGYANAYNRLSAKFDFDQNAPTAMEQASSALFDSMPKLPDLSMTLNDLEVQARRQVTMDNLVEKYSKVFDKEVGDSFDPSADHKSGVSSLSGSIDSGSIAGPSANASKFFDPSNVEYAFVAFTRDWRPVACSYLTHVRPGVKGSFHGFATEEYRHPKYSVPVSTYAMNHFFERFDFRRLESVIAVENIPAVIHATRLGFEWDGVLKEHYQRNDAWVDCHIGTKMRGEK